MKYLKYIILLFLFAGIFISCDKTIKELQVNPNNATSVQPELILGTILNDMAGKGKAGALGEIDSYAVVHRWNQYHCSNFDYYGNNIYSWTNGSFDPYLVLKNVLQMEQEAKSRGAAVVNPYEAIGRFVKAWYFYNLASLFGDVPLTEALQGLENSTPVYSSQKEVFNYALKQLDTANTHLRTLLAGKDNTLSAAQDIYYGGRLALWQKAVNSFKIRVLISLSKKSTEADLNIPAQFAKISNDPVNYPVFTSQEDDLKFTYVSATYSSYRLNPTQYGSVGGRMNTAFTYVNALTSINDPRVFITCEPAWSLVDKGADPVQVKYFVGASTGESLGTMYGNATADKYSNINRYRYFTTFTGEPNVLAGYKELCFNLAEGITRGWAAGNAEDYYKKGITESMKFYGIDITKTDFTTRFLPPGNTALTQIVSYPFKFNFADYYAQEAVKLSSDQSRAIQQIVLQKYIACFENSGYEPYYNWRRTGTPEFKGGTGVGNNGVVPKRWAYPVSEQVQNAANWKAAVTRQNFEADDLNQVMWILK